MGFPLTAVGLCMLRVRAVQAGTGRFLPLMAQLKAFVALEESDYYTKGVKHFASFVKADTKRAGHQALELRTQEVTGCLRGPPAGRWSCKAYMLQGTWS